MMTDDRRRRLRRILMLALAPVALVALVVAGKLVSVNAFGEAADQAFQRRAFAEAEAQARGPLFWNVVEPWKAPFNVGVALGMRGELVEARQQLDDALELHGADGSNEHCIIVTSTVYVVEKQGDEAREAGDRDAANGFYQEALGIVDEAPEGCYDDPSEFEADTGEQLEQSVPRIEEKIEDDSGGGDDESEDGESGESEGEQEEPSSQQEQLEQQNQDAQREQQQRDEYTDQQDGEGGGGGVDRPW